MQEALKKSYMVISDQHGRDKWQPPAREHLAAGNPVIMLGDYVDAFLLTDQQILDNFLDNILLKEQYPDQVTLLLGNHDFSYLNWHWQCSGNRPSMHPYLSILFRKNIQLFQLAHQVENTLFVHAGLTMDWLRYNRQLIERQIGETIEEYVTRWNYAGLLNHVFMSVERNLLWQVSKVHGGYDYYDSPIWVRPSQLLNSLPPGLNQVVGHTNMRQVAEAKEPEGTITFTDTMANANWEPLTMEL